MKAMSLHPQELVRLGNQIEQDYLGALSDHQSRVNRFELYVRKWRNLTEAPVAGEEDKPNFTIPFLRWQTFSQWASTLQSLLGDDAEIIAKPVGPHDQKIVRKIARYMNWRVFDSMRLTTPLAVFLFRAILLGRSHAYAPYKVDKYRLHGQDAVWYDGPGFEPIASDDLIVPAEDVQDIQQFTWAIRKLRVTPQILLMGERSGRYSGVTENWEKILRYSEERGRGGRGRDALSVQSTQVKQAEDEAEGVTREYSLSGSGLWLYEYYCKWRLPKAREADVEQSDWQARDMDESELVVYYQPDLGQVLGIQDLAELYPETPNRRPIVETSLVKDGTYWAPGFGEMLFSIEDEMTAHHRAATLSAFFGGAPVILYSPASGFNPKTFTIEPGMAIPCADPTGVRVVTFPAAIEPALAMNQVLQRYGEAVTGKNDQNAGLESNRPNAPDTARGQVLLAEQGNVRSSLHTTFFREDLARIVEHIWFLDVQFAPRNQFFRVTEEDAKGLWPVRNGGAQMTDREWGGRYDFDIKFATSYWDKEAQKGRQLELYALDIQNPLVATNPRALWIATNKAHEALGDDNFRDIIPEPPDLGMPRQPAEEWTMILQGEDVMVNPGDNDDLHAMAHFQQLAGEREAGETADQRAMDRLAGHIVDHQRQQKQKQLMQAMVQGLARTIGQNTAMPGSPGLNASTAGIPMSLQNLQGFLGNINGGQEQPGGGGPPKTASPAR